MDTAIGRPIVVSVCVDTRDLTAHAATVWSPVSSSDSHTYVSQQFFMLGLILPELYLWHLLLFEISDFHETQYEKNLWPFNYLS